MSLTVAQVYSARFGVKLPLPGSVQDNIARLRITPASYKPIRHVQKQHHKQKHEVTPENWRIKSITGYVSRIKDNDDPDYHNIFGILNKLSSSNLCQLSGEAVDIISKRDQEFRLRVSTLLFNKAISESIFASVMADFAVILNNANPEIREDLILQANMFPKLYDINITLTYPSTTDESYDDKVILWMKQKDKRRGYAKFLTQLYVRDLVTDESMLSAVDQVITEMKTLSRMPRTEQTDENTTQFVDFLFESSKLLPVKSLSVRELIKSSISSFLKLPRGEVPSLGMRSRFRLEDTLKCVQ